MPFLDFKANERVYYFLYDISTLLINIGELFYILSSLFYKYVIDFSELIPSENQTK